MPLSPYAEVFGFDVSLKLYSHKVLHYFWFAGGYSFIFNFWVYRNIFSFTEIHSKSVRQLNKSIFNITEDHCGALKPQPASSQ